MSENNDIQKVLVIGISSRALFELEHENRIFETEGLEAYARYQQEHEGMILQPGPAFPLVQSLVKLNDKIGDSLIEVIVISQNTPLNGMRIMHSSKFYNLQISRWAFSGGSPLAPILQAYEVDLYLSKSFANVQSALDTGIASAQLYDPPANFNPDSDELRIAFDGDAVLFSEEAEIIYKQKGLDAFIEHEKVFAEIPLPEGPFGRVLRTLSRINTLADKPVIRIAIITARGGPAHERVIHTLQQWCVKVDEAYFLNGLSKSSVLKAFNAHIFFDDQDCHVEPASEHVPAGRVPYYSSSPLSRPEKKEEK